MITKILINSGNDIKNTIFNKKLFKQVDLY